MIVTQPRRTHSEEFKRSLIEACGEPSASVAGVALANGINANQLRCGIRDKPSTDENLLFVFEVMKRARYPEL